jgi:hypothetical protein
MLHSSAASGTLSSGMVRPSYSTESMSALVSSIITCTPRKFPISEKVLYGMHRHSSSTILRNSTRNFSAGLTFEIPSGVLMAGNECAAQLCIIHQGMQLVSQTIISLVQENGIQDRSSKSVPIIGTDPALFAKGLAILNEGDSQSVIELFTKLNTTFSCSFYGLFVCPIEITTIDT